MIGSLIILSYVIISVALMTLAERKVMGSMQRRIGPNQVGYLGQQQPFGDGIKLIQKETVLPLESNSFLFLFSPYLIFLLALLNWLIIPLDSNILLSELEGGGILIIIAISELGIYGIIFSGWSANSKYPFQGALRSTAQMISYSVSLSLILLSILFINGSLNQTDFYINQSASGLNQLGMQPIGFLFIIIAVAETNRAPFDLPEAESELVAGFMTEHGGVSFAYFFLAEYANIQTICTQFSILFVGKFVNQPLIFVMLWLRSSLPRLRFDQLLILGWNYILPITIAFVIFIPSLIFSLDLIA